MKLYKITFDCKDGAGIRWASSKDGAGKMRKAVRQQYAGDGGGVTFTEEVVVEVPHRRSDIAAFLNEHASGNA